MVIKDGISQEQAEFKVGREYKDLRDLDPEDDDYKDSLRALGFASQDSKKYLKEAQDKDRMPSPGSSKMNQKSEEIKAQQNEWKQNWSENIPKEITKASSLDVNGTNYDLSDEDKKSIESTLKSRIVEGFDLAYTGKYFDESSRTWDVQKMIADEAWKNSGIRGRILSKLAGNKVAEGSRKAVSTVKNTDFTTKGKPSTSETVTQKESDAWDKVASGLGL
jgi:hypothetical protein